MEAKRTKCLVSSSPPNNDDDIDTTKSPISRLNACFLVRIFQFLPYADRMRVQRVCKAWREQSKEAWRRERSVTLRDVDWGYTNNHHLSFITNKIIVKILRQCSPESLTRLDFCVSRVDNSCTHFLKRFKLHSFCVVLILNFYKLKAVHLTNIQLESNACRQLVFDLFVIAPIEEFSMGVCPIELRQEISKRFFAMAKTLRVLSLPLELVDKENVKSLSPEKLETVHYEATFNVDLPDMFFDVHKTFHNLRSISIHLKEEFSPRQFERLLSIISDNIKAIEIVKLFYTYDVLTPIRFFKNINELTHLRKLIVVGTCIKVKDAIFSAVGEHCKELTHIELGGMQNLTDKGIERFADLPKLQEFRLSRIRLITDKPLGRMTQLRRLQLFNCPHVENGGLDELLRYGDLELVDLEFCIRLCLEKFMKTALTVKTNLPPGSTLLRVIFRMKKLRKEKTTRVLQFLEFKKVLAVPRIIQPHHNHEQARPPR